MFDEDNRDKSPFYRPKATIRISSPDGDALAIEIPELVIDPAPLAVDDTAKLEAARQIAHFESAQAEEIAERLQDTDPILSAAIRRELERRATRTERASR